MLSSEMIDIETNTDIKVSEKDRPPLTRDYSRRPVFIHTGSTLLPLTLFQWDAARKRLPYAIGSDLVTCRGEKSTNPTSNSN